MSHTAQSQHSAPSHNGAASNGASVQALRPAVWFSREEALRARDAERRGQAEAIRAVHGTTKHEYLAAVLGVSRQRVARCLRDGFSAEQMARLGIGAAQSKAA